MKFCRGSDAAAGRSFFFARRMGALRAFDGNLIGVPVLPLPTLMRVGLEIGSPYATWFCAPGVMLVMALAAALT